ncbi:MAG TPA: hypothetical protein VLA13_01405 [Massilibacterium sp.]|nr:hypothetical protein [Massilibacterium sp.]
MSALKSMGSFLMINIAGLLFLLGIGFVVYGIFLWSTVIGFISLGFALITVGLIIHKESND